MGSLAGFGGWLFLLGVALSVLRFIFLIEFEELAAFLFSAASFLVGTVLMIVGWMKVCIFMSRDLLFSLF